MFSRCYYYFLDVVKVKNKIFKKKEENFNLIL